MVKVRSIPNLTKFWTTVPTLFYKLVILEVCDLSYEEIMKFRYKNHVGTDMIDHHVKCAQRSVLHAGFMDLKVSFKFGGARFVLGIVYK